MSISRQYHSEIALRDLPQDRWLRLAEAAPHTGLSVSSLRKRIKQGCGPKTYRVAGGVRIQIRAGDLALWIASGVLSAPYTDVK